MGHPSRDEGFALCSDHGAAGELQRLLPYFGMIALAGSQRTCGGDRVRRGTDLPTSEPDLQFRTNRRLQQLPIYLSRWPGSLQSLS
jgi:hypothetical protein